MLKINKLILDNLKNIKIIIVKLLEIHYKLLIISFVLFIIAFVIIWISKFWKKEVYKNKTFAEVEGTVTEATIIKDLFEN